MPDNVLIASDITVELGSAYVGSAYSPQASVEQTDTGWELTITYADPDTPGELATLTIPVDSAGFGEVTASVESGHGTPQVVVTESGPDTAKSFHFAFSGIGGFSPTITVTEIEHGHRVTVTDVDGTESFDVLDGDPSQAIEDAERAAAAANAAAATADTSAAAADTATAAAQTATTAAQGATSAAQTATSAANTATGLANTAATSATSAASAAQTATAAAQAATTAADTAADNAQDAADRANAAAAGITDAYSPMFTAGASDGVTGGGPSDTAAWVERVCPGTDGPATIESIHGRTLVWNQMVSSYSQTASGTVSLPAGEVSTVTGHVYYLSAVSSADTVVSNGSYIRFRLYTRASGSNRVIVTMQFNQSGEHKVSTIFTSQYDAVSNGTTSGVEGNIWVYRNNEGGSATGTIDRLMLIDLTRMFGSGNEPNTVAEFERMFPEPHYSYDAGSLLSVNMTGIETEDADGNVLMERTIPAATYFPNGMRSAGSVYDELTESAAITRIGERAYQSGDESDTSVVTDGTVTHYALATPTATAIDPPLNMVYRAERGGTERVLHTEQTAPPTLVVAYGYTAESLLAAAASTLADPDGPTATTNHAVGSYLTMGGTLYRVTTAIAAGETVTPGTNVTATTVMAEVLSLIQ